MSTNDGGSAFPYSTDVDMGRDSTHPSLGRIHTQSGMSLRQWYAGEAMKSLITASGFTMDEQNLKAIAKKSFLIADAMLIESEKGSYP